MEKHRRMYRERSYTVEPMQGLVKDISDLNTCRIHGNSGKRRIFAAMGLTVQLKAWHENRSNFKIRDDVLG